MIEAPDPRTKDLEPADIHDAARYSLRGGPGCDEPDFILNLVAALARRMLERDGVYPPPAVTP